MNRDEIMELLGVSKWQEVEQVFGGMTLSEIKEKLDWMFPSDDNAELASAIHDQLN